MARTLDQSVKRPRISIDVEPGFRRKLRLAAARRDVTVRQYVLEAIETQLRQDAMEDRAALAPLTAASDPVLAELWDNELDAAYDRL
jgi:hypothetical protein